MDTNENLGQIALSAQSIIDLCRSDIEDNSEPVEALTQKIGYLADSQLDGAGLNRELSDWVN